MHPEAERLATAFIGHFWAADHEIRWLDIEQEHALWLDDNTVLVGKIDATGLTLDGDKFFADWKTGSKNKARYMEKEKTLWRFNPQALTYGLFAGDETRRFMVRWALKTDPATCDHEWYTYTAEELDIWKRQLLNIAADIRLSRARTAPWELNLDNCTRYGETYACPFRNDGCWKGQFNFTPETMLPRIHSHIGMEDEIKSKHKDNPNLVVLGSSRVGDWLNCHEFFRRLHEGMGLTEENEALSIGTDFHTLIAAHLTNIKAEQEEAVCSSQ